MRTAGRHAEGAYYLEWRESANASVSPSARTPKTLQHGASVRKPNSMPSTTAFLSCQNGNGHPSVAQIPGRNGTHKEAKEPWRRTRLH
jgi:hypothetical protein